MPFLLDYYDENLRKLILDMLQVFGPLDESSIDRIVTIFHYKGDVNAGEIKLSQGSPYSEKWRLNASDLIEEGHITREKEKKVYSLTHENKARSKFREFLEALKNKSWIERDQLAISLHKKAVENYYRNDELVVPTEELNNLLKSYGLPST